MKSPTCPYGHRYTPSNTYRDTAGARRCRRCEAARSRAAYVRTTPRVRPVSLARTRVALGWTQARLAAEMGISRVHLAHVETGKARFGEAALARLFAVLAREIESVKAARAA